MKEFVVIRKTVSYFTQTVPANSIEEAIEEASEYSDWEFLEQDEEVYGEEVA